MKSNLSVFTSSPYPKWQLYNHMKHFMRNVKYAWQRATKGYCDRDLWNLDKFYSQLFEDSLVDFAGTTHGAPDKYFSAGEENEIEPWQERLHDIALCFRVFNAREEMLPNPYRDEMMELSSLRLLKNEDGLTEMKETNESEYFKELSRLYFEREKENDKAVEDSVAEGFEMLKEDFFSLWD